MKTTTQYKHSQKDCSTLATVRLLGLCLALPSSQGPEIALGLLNCKALGGPRDAVVEAGVSNCFERARITYERPKGPKAVKRHPGRDRWFCESRMLPRLSLIMNMFMITQKCRCFSATIIALLLCILWASSLLYTSHS